MAKKRDYLYLNRPLVFNWCKENGVNFEWKNEDQGHVILSNENTELYVWLQRMVIEVRKVNGIYLSKPWYDRSNERFSPKLFAAFFKQTTRVGKLYAKPRYRKGVVVTVIKKGTPDKIKANILDKARNLAANHSTKYA